MRLSLFLQYLWYMFCFLCGLPIHTVCLFFCWVNFFRPRPDSSWSVGAFRLHSRSGVHQLSP